MAGWTLAEYVTSAGVLIRLSPLVFVFHRISASGRGPTLLAPLWCENRWTGMVELNRYMLEFGGQASGL